MPQLTQNELAQRRVRVAFLLLTGVPRAEIPSRIGITRKAVARDIAALAKAIDHDTGSNREALEQTIAALQDAGRLERVDSAKLATLRSMANQLDLDTSNSMMFRVYWDSLEALTADGNDDGELDALARRLFSDARDAPEA